MMPECCWVAGERGEESEPSSSRIRAKSYYPFAVVVVFSQSDIESKFTSAKTKNIHQKKKTRMSFKPNFLLIAALLACSLFVVSAENRKLLSVDGETVLAELEGFNEALSETAGDFFVGTLMPEGGLPGLGDLGGIWPAFIEGIFEAGGNAAIDMGFVPTLTQFLTGRK